jgi:hypothetical protein
MRAVIGDCLAKDLIDHEAAPDTHDEIVTVQGVGVRCSSEGA